MDIVEQAYYKSLELMKKNSSAVGFLAAADTDLAQKRGYRAVFARDAMICVLGALSCGDKKLLETAKQSLIFLAQNSDSRGQIPFSVNYTTKAAHFRVPRSIDSTLWWLIGFWLLTEELGDKTLKSNLQENFERSLNWLHYYLNYGLLEQGEGADWADEMPRSGLVLYSNALWLIFLNLINSKEKSTIYNNFLYFFSDDRPSSASAKFLDRQFPYWQINRRKLGKRKKYFRASVSRVTCDDGFDIFGNILAGLSGCLSIKKINEIILEINKSKSARIAPVRVLAEPVKKSKQGAFEASHQNKPWHYHNAGIWPLVGGFWVYFLAKNKKNKSAANELRRLAELNSINNWEFNEWFHGQTGRPLGVKHQTWNAAAYIVAYNAVRENKYII